MSREIIRAIDSAHLNPALPKIHTDESQKTSRSGELVSSSSESDWGGCYKLTVRGSAENLPNF